MRELAEIAARAVQAAPACRFADRRDAAVQFVPAETATAQSLLVCLCGLDGRIGMPLNLFHRWLVGLPAHVLYLRDPANASFTEGIAELGEGPAAMAIFVRHLAATLGTRHLAIYGNSMGGFAAAKLGARAAAQRIVVAGGIARVRTSGERKPPTIDELEAARQSACAEIQELLRQAETVPEIVSVFSTGIRRDTADAQALAGLGCVRLMPVERGLHNVATELARSGSLGPLLAWLVGRGDVKNLIAPSPAQA